MSGSAASAGGGAVRHVRVERRGGVGGLKASGERSAEQLSPAERSALAGLLKATAGEAPAATSAPGADRFRYRVCVTEADGSERNFDLGEDELPESLCAIARPTLP